MEKSTRPSYLSILKQTVSEWSSDKAPRLGAALAYYTIFSLPPLLVIVISIAGLVFGREAAQGQLVEQLQGLLGRDGGKAIETMIAHTGRKDGSLLAAALGVVVLLFGASGVFAQLKDALNTIWGIEIKSSQGIIGIVRERLFNFGMVLALGFLFLVSLVVSTALAAIEASTANLVPGPDVVAVVLHLVVSFAIFTILFAFLLKALPDAKFEWRVVWVGAAITSLLFMLGKFLIGLYLGRSDVASAYGVAGSLVILLVWIYYSAQIFLLGAEFTQVYAYAVGADVVPRGDARFTDEPKVEEAEHRTEKVKQKAPRPRLRLVERLPSPSGRFPWASLATVAGAIFTRVRRRIIRRRRRAGFYR